MTARMKPLLFLLAAFSALAADAPRQLLWPDGAPGAKGNTEKDQPWLDLHLVPKEKANGAAFVVCPGGGYGGLAADHEGTQVARWFNGLGVSAFVLHYRLGTSGYHFPTQLMDVQRAIRHVRANAEKYGIDSGRLGIIGFSAGGHLTSMAATMFDEKPAGMTNDAVDQVSARPDVAAPTYPVISMIEAFGHKGSRKNLLGPGDNDELARRVSTEARVTESTPPVFIFQTDEDIVVPAENAVAFYLACRKHKVPAELHIYRPGPHGVGLILGDPVLGTWSAHLRDWLRNQGFFKPSARGAVEGRATVNGKPVSWGRVVFEPADANAPLVCARIMMGKFILDAKNGPPVGPVTLRVSGSAADVPGAESADGTLSLTKVANGSPASLSPVIAEGVNKMQLDLAAP